MPGFHMIATIDTIVAVAAIVVKKKKRASGRCKNQNSAIDIIIICVSAGTTGIWQILIAAIATIAEKELFLMKIDNVIIYFYCK